MNWIKWIIVGLMVLSAGWMTFDGARAFIVGDYVTPKSGEYAGQLGPWSKLVEAVGIQSRSNLMKGIFVGYGMLALIVTAVYAFQLSWGWGALMLTAVMGLWYLPIGTIANLIVIVLLFFQR